MMNKAQADVLKGVKAYRENGTHNGQYYGKVESGSIGKAIRSAVLYIGGLGIVTVIVLTIINAIK